MTSKPLLLALLLLLTYSAAQAQALHPWTDLQGRTLQASFVKSDGTTVTINWNGQVVPIPLATLAPASQELAKKLAAEAAFGSVGAPALYPWTDLQGRTLQAKFVKADATTVTIDWQGQVIPLPLATLAPASQALAKKLSGSSPTAPTPSTPSVPVPAAPPKPKRPTPTVVTGEVALEAEHNWEATTGTVIKAKFVSIDGEDVNLLMYGGRAEQSVPLARLSKTSQELAKKLQADLDKQTKLRGQEAAKRKKMEVPSVVEADITRYHKWQSSDGNEIEAMYVDAKDSGVTLLMKKNPNKPYELGWERLSPESQALAEGIRRLKEELTPANPVIAPYSPASEKRKSAVLPRYTQGKWKNYNTVLESAVYDVALHSNGYTVHIWLKDAAESEDAGLGERAKRVPLSVNFRPIYFTRPGEQNSRVHRRIKTFEDAPFVSNEREVTMLKGTLENDAAFEYHMEINHRGLSFWGEIDEDRKEEFPTFFSIAFYSPNFIPNVTDMALKDIEPIVGDGALYIDPMESKRAKIPMMMKWEDVMKKFEGAEWNPIKSAEFVGKPFGSHKIKVTPANTRDMYYRWSKGYSGIYPFQAIHLIHSTEDSYILRHSRDKDIDYSQYKDRGEIPKNKRLNVNIIRGRG